MSDDRKGFTVKDRRMFTPDGVLREPQTDEAKAPREEPIEPPQPAPPVRDTPAGAGGAGQAGVDFTSFLMSLAAQAEALLGEASGPSGGQDLSGVRQIIGILEMLKDKTAGRRTPAEDRVLEGLLYELRLAFVEVARGVSP